MKRRLGDLQLLADLRDRLACQQRRDPGVLRDEVLHQRPDIPFGAGRGRAPLVVADLGGSVQTGVRVTSLDQLTGADATVFDLAPAAVADIAGDRLPRRVRRRLRTIGRDI